MSPIQFESTALKVEFDGLKAVKLSCVLPEGHRFEMLVGPSVQTDLSQAIRCKHPFTPTWEQLALGRSRTKP